MDENEVQKDQGNPERKDEAKRNIFDPGSFFLEEDLSEEEFQKRSRLFLISSVFFMIAGPLFTYYGFYLLTWPRTVKWGALSIALGLLILLFAFSMWQDRQLMALRRLIRTESTELRRILIEREGNRDTTGGCQPQEKGISQDTGGPAG